MTADLPPPPSARDRRIIQIALRETDPAFVARFRPITRGPVVAVLGLGCLGLYAGFYVAWLLLKKGLGR